MLKPGRKKTGESRGFLIFWMGIINEDFHIEANTSKDERCEDKIHARAREVLQQGLGHSV